MSSSSIFFGTFIVLALLSRLESFDVTSEMIIGETKKLESAKEIFDAIKESDFVKTVQGVAKWGLPLLQSINSFAKIIMGSVQSDSKELQYMKEQFKIVNDKMDTIDQKFENVKKMIDWNVIKIQYTKYEISIDVIQNKIHSLTDAPKNVKEILIADFIRTYDQLYQNAAETIYNGFVNSNAIFSENLIVAIRKYTKDHRFQVEEFFMGNIQLLFKAYEVETFYLNLKNYTSVSAYMQSKWEQNLKTLTELMTSVLEQVTVNWVQQSKSDIDDFSVENYQKSHETYAKGLYDMLNDKFRHRTWLVLVYDPLNSGTDHAFKMCDGYSAIELRGHNIFVGSVGKSENRFNPAYYSNICGGLSKNLLNWKDGPAEDLIKNYVSRYINCDVVKFAVMIRSKSTKVVMAPVGHVSNCRWSGYYNKFVDIHKTLDLIVMG